MTEAEVTACQVKLDALLAKFDRPGLIGKVRQYVGWTDEETGEWNPGVWVAEVRYGRGDAMRVVTLDLEAWQGDYIDEIWEHEVEMLIR